MDITEHVMNVAAAESLAKTQMAIATKVLKLAQGQDQATAQMVTDAMENVQESLMSLAEGLGDSFDVRA